MLLLDIPSIQSIILSIGLEPFYSRLIQQLEDDFKHWQSFYKSPRHAIHYKHGVIELMPCSDDELYSFKYVNGHPENTKQGNLCVMAIGMLADVKTGYPLMISEMTLLTAIRTAAVAALGAKYLARTDSNVLCIIGSGAQSEFQAMAMKSILPIDEIRIYDIDAKAMDKFYNNLTPEFNRIKKCESIAEAILNSDIIITATACKKKACLFKASEITDGTHIHAMGGDCPGKTELDASLLKKSKLVVEFTEQSLIEGEIQQLDISHIHGELWQIINKLIPGRENNNEITIFDSVGFAIEDFSILKLVYTLAQELKLGVDIDLIPDIDDPKNLYGLINNPLKRKPR